MASSRLRALVVPNQHNNLIYCVSPALYRTHFRFSRALQGMKSMLLPVVLGLFSAILLPAQQQKAASPGTSFQQDMPPLPPSIYGEENLHTLSLSDSRLHAATPLPGEKDTYPEFTRELLEVQWRDGDPIDLWLIKPRGVVKPPVVLYLYSYPSETDRFRDNEYCKRITSNGYAAVGFVSALTGHRYHDRPMREWFISEMPEALIKSVHDVQMIVRYLSDRGDTDVAHLGMFGSGSGATIAILSAAVEPHIRAVEALQPWGDWPTWLAKSSLIPEAERPTYLKPEFLSTVAPLDPVQWVGRVQTKALQIQFVMDDTVTPVAAIQHMKVAMTSSAQVLEYPTRRQQYQLLGGGRAFDWIKEQLRAPDVESARADDHEHKAQTERTH